MSDQAQHTMQFVITNDTSEAKTYTLFDVPESLSGGETFGEDFFIENLIAASSWGPAPMVTGQTWLQTKTAKLKHVSFYVDAQAANPTALLEIINNDTSAVIGTYNFTLNNTSPAYATYKVDVDVDVVAGVNYYFRFTPGVIINVSTNDSNPYPDGLMVLNGTDYPGTDLWFKLEFEETVSGSNPDISTTGTLDYNSLVSSLQGEPISINRLSVIAPTSEQLENNLEFHNVTIEGHIKNYKVSVQNHKSPLDVSPIVKMRLAKPVIFGSNENETIEYTVDANTEVKLIFNFVFTPKVQDAIDIEHEVITEDEPIKVKKQEIINKEQPKTETITLEQEDRRVHNFLIGLIIAITLTNTILWIRE